MVATERPREDIEDLFRRYLDTPDSGQQAETLQELSLVIKTMGVRRLRPGGHVAVRGESGQVQEIPLERLTGEGLSFAYRLAFRHE